MAYWKLLKGDGNNMGKNIFLKVKDHVIETIHIYDDLIATQMCMNQSDKCMKMVHEDGKIGVDFAGTYDGDNVTFYYTFEKMPQVLPIDFKQRLRACCRRGVRVNLINAVQRHKINWESAEMQSRMHTLKTIGQQNSERDVDVYNLYDNLGAIGKQKWVESSLRYLAIADKQRKRSLVSSAMMMIVTGTRGDDFDDSIKDISESCTMMGIDAERVLYEIPDTVKYFSPFSMQYNQKLKNGLAVQVLTDELLARYSTFNQGKIGLGGTYCGTDIDTGFPVLKQVKRTDQDAEVWLITAETGGGKSLAIKTILLQLLARNFRGTIMDVEGKEYTPMANFISHQSTVQVLNMGEGTGKYFDPVEIPELTGIDDIDDEAQTLSVNFTLAIFKVLVGKAYDRNDWIDIVINDAVTETYSALGVTEDRATWKNSKGLTLKAVYDKLITLKTHRQEAEYGTAFELCRALLGKYFEENGTRSNVFKNRVAIKDIIYSDLIICSFGMAGKSEHTVDQIQLALMQLSAAQISHQRSIYSKSQGLFNFKIWEEFQRWGDFPDSDKTIGVAVTGGRKLGDMNIIATNDVDKLLRNDKFGIMSNKTSYMIGAISDADVRERLCARLSIKNMLPELTQISTAHKNFEKSKGRHGSVSESKYTHAFLGGFDNTDFSVMKVIMPQDVVDSDLFRTGIDKPKKSKVRVRE